MNNTQTEKNICSINDTKDMNTNTSKTIDTNDDKTSNITNIGSYNKMDSNNKKAMDVWAEKGYEEAVKFMTNPTDDKPLSYYELRKMFG